MQLCIPCAKKHASINVYVCIGTQVYLHNVCMPHTSSCAPAHLCHRQLCSTCWGRATLPFTPPLVLSRSPHCAVPKETGILPTQETPQQAEHCRALFNKGIHKMAKRHCVLLETHSFQNQRGEAAEEGICLCKAQSGSLVKAMTAKCEWKNPTGTQAVRSSTLGQAA